MSWKKRFACYLDEERALRWWHRVAVRQQENYYLRGWKQGRIFPDFVAMTTEDMDDKRVLIVDTKGEHLGGNADTEYKRKVLETLQGAFNHAGTLKVREGSALKGVFRLVFNESQFPEISAQLTGEL